MKNFESIKQEIIKDRFKIKSYDLQKPWGGYFVIEEAQLQKFTNIYFDESNNENIRLGGEISPKLLTVKPRARLSWQFQYRRA